MSTIRLGPRDQRAAARTAAGLLLAGALALLTVELIAVLAGPAQASPAVLLAGVVIVALAATVWFLYERLPQWLWVVVAVAMVGAILWLDLLTADAGGGAQVAFLYPVVYAGAFLRPGAAWTVAGSAVVAHAVVVLTLLPPDRALGDSAFMLVAVLALTGVLVRSGLRQDALVGRLHTLAAVDGLTGLATRREFEDVAERTLLEPVDVGELARLAGIDGRQAPAPLGTGLLLLDLDMFKELNDAHGHQAGDAALVHAATVLRQAVRPGDTVARLGGDELAVLLPGVGHSAVADRAEALRRAVRDAPLGWGDLQIQVTVSVGVAHTGTGGTDFASLYSAADDALYRAKRAGRNQVVVA